MTSSYTHYQLTDPRPSPPTSQFDSVAALVRPQYVQLTRPDPSGGPYARPVLTPVPQMLPRRIAQAPALRSVAQRRLPIVQRRGFLPNSMNDKAIYDEKYPDPPTLTDAEDPHMNGGYINPPRVKRQFRDPHGDWWDKQERRNFGEPVHEDHDILGMFSPHEYTWVSPAKGALQFGAFVLTFLGVCWVVKATYPDKQSYPREFEGGLERELGGKGAMRARSPNDPEPFQAADEEEA